MKMRVSEKRFKTFLPFLSLSLLLGSACGMRNTGTYTLNQMGAQFQNAQCSTVRLSVNESGGQISGQGSTPCYNQTLSGTIGSNGQMNVTLSLIPVMGAQTVYSPYGGAGSQQCTYQGVLSVSGNTLQGVLNPVSSFGYGCSGSITINGTRN
jgi:hypothetical protein